MVVVVVVVVRGRGVWSGGSPQPGLTVPPSHPHAPLSPRPSHTTQPSPHHSNANTRVEMPSPIRIHSQGSSRMVRGFEGTHRMSTISSLFETLTSFMP